MVPRCWQYSTYCYSESLFFLYVMHTELPLKHFRYPHKSIIGGSLKCIFQQICYLHHNLCISQLIFIESLHKAFMCRVLVLVCVFSLKDNLVKYGQIYIHFFLPYNIKGKLMQTQCMELTSFKVFVQGRQICQCDMDIFTNRQYWCISFYDYIWLY